MPQNIEPEVRVYRDDIDGIPVVVLKEIGNMNGELLAQASERSSQLLREAGPKASYVVDLSEVGDFESRAAMLSSSLNLLQTPFKKAYCVTPSNAGPVTKFLVRTVGHVLPLPIIFVISYAAAQAFIKEDPS